MNDDCPICGDHFGFHFEEIHAARPILEGKALPPLENIPLCRACGMPIASDGAEDCRYPNHTG